jgi:peptidoglycan/LPS O-acetylase OafA/YrhL
MQENAMTQRFHALDSWRGLCAVMVAFYHFNAYSHVHLFPLVRYAYLFVDFFFVLSGFVITAGYLTRLQNGFPLRDFIFLRLARIYPLHLFMLLLFVVFSFVKFAAEGAVPFSKESQSLESLGASLLLIQGLGIYDYLVWNMPAWTISVEFYTYIIFAIAVIAARQWVFALVALYILWAAYLFWPMGFHKLDIVYFFPRCLFGFCAGMLCRKLYEHIADKGAAIGKIAGNILEITVFALVMAFVWQAGNSTLSSLAPFVFALCVLVFAFEKGMISAVLKTKPFLALGLWSYSIYMVHTFVQSCFYSGLRLLEKFSGETLHHHHDIAGREPMMGHTRWEGDLWFLAMIVAVIVFSSLTYRFIERPAQDWARLHVRNRAERRRIALTKEPPSPITDAIKR